EVPTETMRPSSMRTSPVGRSTLLAGSRTRPPRISSRSGIGGLLCEVLPEDDAGHCIALGAIERLGVEVVLTGDDGEAGRAGFDWGCLAYGDRLRADAAALELLPPVERGELRVRCVLADVGHEAQASEARRLFAVPCDVCVLDMLHSLETRSHLVG